MELMTRYGHVRLILCKRSLTQAPKADVGYTGVLVKKSGNPDEHNMASLLRSDKLNRLIDAATCTNPETAFCKPLARQPAATTLTLQRDYVWWNTARFMAVPPGPEFETVQEQLRESLPTAKISKLERVQHPLLWNHYSRRRDVLQMKNGGDANEKILWHGTSGLCPKELLGTSEAGLDMRFSNLSGFYGSGIYFAVNARYSHHGRYVYQDPKTSEWVLVACQVSVGSAFEMGTQVCREARLPPVVRGAVSAGIRHDSVKGGPHRPAEAGPGKNDSEMYVVYNNEQVYPAYIIYYKV